MAGVCEDRQQIAGGQETWGEMTIVQLDEFDETSGGCTAQLLRDEPEAQRAHISRLGVGDRSSIGQQILNAPGLEHLFSSQRVASLVVLMPQELRDPGERRGGAMEVSGAHLALVGHVPGGGIHLDRVLAGAVGGLGHRFAPFAPVEGSVPQVLLVRFGDR